MKINPNYIALCKQFIIDTKTTRREETKKLHDELLEKIVLFEIADFDKAIKISRRYAKDQNLIQDLIEQRTLFLNSGKAPKEGFRFTDIIIDKLSRNKRYKTKDMIEMFFKEEFPEAEETATISRVVGNLVMVPFIRLNFEDSTTKLPLLKKSQRTDLKELLELL